MCWWRDDLWFLTFPFNIYTHPVDQVEIYIIKLKFLETCSESFFHVVLIVVPQLSCDPKIFSFDACGETLLKSFTNCFLVSIQTCRVDVTVAILEDSIFDLLFAIVKQESSKTKNWDFCSIIKSECWTFYWGYCLFAGCSGFLLSLGDSLLCANSCFL